MKSNCSVCGKRKSQFVAIGSGILSNLGLRTPFRKIPLLGDSLFSL